MSGADLFRLYEPGECGGDGYPVAWHQGEPAIKDLVRELAGHRCVRCRHPFIVGKSPGEWSHCGPECVHDGPVRFKPLTSDEWTTLVPLTPGGFPSAIRYAFRQGMAVEALWRVLTVHHLTGEKHDCRWWNLAALCQRCHLEIQGRVRMEQVYPFEHSEWFKPYAAGYYAATYLGDDLTREETVERIDELLALESALSPTTGAA